MSDVAKIINYEPMVVPVWDSSIVFRNVTRHPGKASVGTLNSKPSLDLQHVEDSDLTNQRIELQVPKCEDVTEH